MLCIFWPRKSFGFSWEPRSHYSKDEAIASCHSSIDGWFLTKQYLVQEMKEKIVLIIALGLSLVGIVCLFFLQPGVSPAELKLTGEITKISDKGSIQFIEFAPDDLLTVSFKGLDLEKGNVTLVGRLQEYKGRVEFVVMRVE